MRILAPAFTLIEVLVVIAIIGLLLAVLLPALGAARATSRVQACLSNVRSQSAVMAMYTLDHQDALPPRRVDWSDIDDDGNFVGRIYAMNSFLADYTGEPLVWPASGFPPITGIWRCPNVDEEEDFPNRFTHAGYQHHAPNRWLFTYAVVSEDQGISNFYSETLAGWDSRWPIRQWRKTFVVDRPTDIITLMDNVVWFNQSHGHSEGREYHGTACDFVESSDSCAEDNVGAHPGAKRLPATFLDGHGEAMPQQAAWWMQRQAAYRAGGPSATLWDAEVRHLMWFVRQSDRTNGGGGGGD